ncbi:acyloxyacyl hydrolase [Flexithrix dorotheae]|uniref:acyloxyacyl hydrolase n=1 Tax=Flexithrix dorotheae TaxID=70993 RepID=UPI0003680370|nr:acyloxyacyl hydrolase [Flexithrix dorotheae]
MKNPGWFITSMVCLVCSAFSCFSQEKNWFVGSGGHVGFIIPHDQSLKEVSKSNPWGFQIETGLILTGENAWENCNCFSKMGLGFYYFNYQNPQELGSSYNLMLFGEPYLGFKSRFFMTIRGGMGISYLNQVYDEISNPNNLFYSSPISFILLANLGFNFKITPSFTAQIGVNYNHISNGGARQPNKGMNFPTISVGLEKNLNDLQFPEYSPKSGLLSKPWQRYLIMGGSRRTLEKDSINKETAHLNIGLEGGVMRAVSNVNGISGGFEFYYNGAQGELSERNTGAFKPFLFSLMLGHALIFGRFSFTQQIGFYAYKPYEFNDKSFFQRYAVYYRWGKWFNVGVSLKAHGHVADFMDVRVGARW